MQLVKLKGLVIMKMSFRILVVIIVLLGLILSCGDSLVNKATFYPEKGSVVNIDRLPPSIRHHIIPTEDGEQLSAFFFRADSANKTILYFHGNAGNASGRLLLGQELATLHANVLLLDYRGYGLSSGSPSEAGIYTDGRAALNYLVNVLHADPATLFLYGRSLGSAVAIEIANDLPMAGLILVTPISSGKQVAENGGYGALASLIGNPFDNVGKFSKVNLPTLILHGDRDEVLPLDMGKSLKEAAPAQTRLIVIPGAGHNNIESINKTQYYQYIDTFCNAVLTNQFPIQDNESWSNR